MHKISIVQRGFGALGYTMQLPTEDRYLQTRGDLLSQMAVLLGGRTAEEIVLRRDLDRRAERPDARHRHRARDGHGARHERRDRPGQSRRPRSARRSSTRRSARARLHAEETAQLIDTEVHRLLTEADDRARNILHEHREALERVTEQLLNKEVIEQDELLALYRGDPDTLPVVQPAPTTFNV